MAISFANILSGIRHEKGISQRRAAADLKISQALLSHYENGAREPGLQFVCRACDYYGVSADYLLGRTESPEMSAVSAPMSTLAALEGTMRERDSREVEAAVGKYLAAVSNRLSSEINGTADEKILSRTQLDMAEAEHALAVLFPADKHRRKND